MDKMVHALEAIVENTKMFVRIAMDFEGIQISI